jgi:scavenger receptor class B, member 1
LSASSKAFEEWKKPTVPLYLDVYFFNWTNSEEFLDTMTKPIMRELGPYRFREIRDKKIIAFNNDNSTVSYKTISTFYFDEDGSNGTLDDEITQLNIVAVGASAQALTLEYIKRKQVSIGLNAYEQKIATTKTARELLFDGYEDDMLSMGRANLLDGFEVQDNPYDKIGWFYLVRREDENLKRKVH